MASKCSFTPVNCAFSAIFALHSLPRTRFSTACYDRFPKKLCSQIDNMAKANLYSFILEVGRLSLIASSALPVVYWETVGWECRFIGIVTSEACCVQSSPCLPSQHQPVLARVFLLQFLSSSLKPPFVIAHRRGTESPSVSSSARVSSNECAVWQSRLLTNKNAPEGALVNR